MLIKLPAIFGEKSKTEMLKDNGISIEIAETYLEIQTQYKYEEPVNEDDDLLGRKITIVDEVSFTWKHAINQVGYGWDSDYEVHFVSIKVANFNMFINVVDKKNCR